MPDPSSYDATFDYPSSPSITIITDASDSSNSSGLDTVGKITIAIVVILTCLVGSFILLLYCGHRSIERVNKANYFKAKALEPDLTYRLWKLRQEDAVLRDAARVELEEADREFAAHREREESRTGVARIEREKKAGFASRLAGISFMKNAQVQNWERVHMENFSQEPSIITMPLSVSTTQDQQRGGAAPGVKIIFPAQEGKQGNGKKTQGKTRTRASFFAIIRGPLTVKAAEGGRVRVEDEESLVGRGKETREAPEVDALKPAKRTTWGSEAPPPYERLLTKDQQHTDDSHSDGGP